MTATKFQGHSKMKIARQDDKTALRTVYNE